MSEEKLEELKQLLFQDRLTDYGKRQLVELIEKQQKEIEELELKIAIQNSFGGINTEYCISKDKIKAKIKELENKENLYKEEKRFNEEEIKFNYAKRILQELLEEGE